MNDLIKKYKTLKNIVVNTKIPRTFFPSPKSVSSIISGSSSSPASSSLASSSSFDSSASSSS
jgi:hypothetical protein